MNLARAAVIVSAVNVRGDAQLIALFAAALMVGGFRAQSLAATADDTPCAPTDPVAGDGTSVEGQVPNPTPRRIQISWDRGPVLVVRRILPPSVGTGVGLEGENLLKVRFGLRVSVDAAAYLTGGDLADISNTVEVRRGYVKADGQLDVWKELPFRVELGFVNREFSLEKAYVVVPALPYAGDLTIGQFTTPFSLEATTESSARTFMESALPVAAFAPSWKVGVQLANRTRDRTVTWALGWFADGTPNDVGEDSQSFSRLIGRLTWLPVDGNGAPDAPLVHLGLSGSYVLSTQATIRFQSRPESYPAPKLLNTGDVDAKDAVMLAIEAALVRGPFSIQSEFLGSRVVDRSQGDLTFYGVYTYASWICTGETRPYNRTKGAFARVVPRRDFSWTTWAPGAWEVAARFSYLTLNDGSVRGGTDAAETAGVNWYLNRWLRIQANYNFEDLGGRPQRGPLNVFQMRWDLFW